MYGGAGDKHHLPWNTPSQRRTGADRDSSPDKRHSTGMNFYGLDSPSSSGGFSQVPGHGHSRNSSAAGYGSPLTSGNRNAPEDRNYRERANQIMQAFFWKAAMVIVQARIPVELAMTRDNGPKLNKWFNIEMDEMENFRDEIRLWRSADAWQGPRLPPLIIETYLDTSEMTASQALVISDAAGKRWNVTEALNRAANRGGYLGLRTGDKGSSRSQQVVLERWRLEISPGADVPNHLGLPVVYKKAIILFRALYSYVSLMPTWKFRRRLQKPKLQASALKIGCRVLSSEELTRANDDGLELSFDGDDEVLDEFDFGKVDSPAGHLNLAVQYRKNIDFRVDDSETLLSSQFINLDEHHNRPLSSRHQRTSSQPSAYATARGSEQGSLPSLANPTYGSLSSFHQAERQGASPLSALRTAAEMADRASNSSSERLPPGGGSVHGSRASLRSRDGVINPPSRRGSINFMQPFKSPSLSNSPANEGFAGRQPPGPGSLNPNRLSIGTSSPSSFKSASSNLPQENVSTSLPRPQPAPRIQSSFGARKPRVPSATANRADDDATSSGQASYSSSAARNSQLYGLPSSSLEDDRQIQDFMNLLTEGQQKSLKSLGSTASAESSRNAGNVLSKYQKMRESHSALADSMSSSLLLQPQSPTASTRGLSNPGMVPSTFSSSSSPGKPISPHTPHTPAVPSRLSEGSIARYDTHQQERRQHRPRNLASQERPRTTQEPSAASTATTSPLDIPLSPRFKGPRRANSMSQQHREPIDGNSIDYDPLSSYDNRRQSTSLNSADVDSVPLSMSRLLDLSNAKESPLPGRQIQEEEEGSSSQTHGPPIPPRTLDESRPYPASRFSRGTPPSYSSRFRRPRPETPSADSTSSLEKDSVTRAGLNDRRHASWSKTAEDEDFIFDMSELGQNSRRSLEDGPESGSSSRRRSRGGGSIGEGSATSRWPPPSTGS